MSVSGSETRSDPASRQGVKEANKGGAMIAHQKKQLFAWRPSVRDVRFVLPG